SAPECAARLPKSNGGWTVPTGCVFAAATCRYSLARRRRDLQLLPAYGLQELQIKNPKPKPRSKPNASPLPITLGGNLGSGHFYLAENRTFLLCVDSSVGPGSTQFRSLFWSLPNKKPAGRGSVLRACDFGAACYLTLMKMMAKVY